jgi:tyrosinase
VKSTTSGIAREGTRADDKCLLGSLNGSILSIDARLSPAVGAASMPIEIRVNDSLDPKSRYISLAPSSCQIRQTPAASPLTVTLSSRAASTGGGEAEFYDARVTGAQPTATLTLTLPAAGTWVDFWLAGRAGKPSVDDLDCLLVASSNGAADVTVPLMVRVRKNANTLKDRERDRFLMALAKLNAAQAPAASAYQTLRNMHVDEADGEEHGGPHFLPWHRAYLLDLERQLQTIDPAVSLHYWRFDQPAPKIFSRSFMGATRRSATASLVQLDPTNPLVGWVTDSVPGIERAARFNTLTQPAPGLPGFELLDQAETLALGTVYPAFADMEGTPHGAAHVSFVGWISAIATAPKDPLFFMLHANVDRLWAMWQWINRRTDAAQPDTYTGENRDGRRAGDTMWPWNGIITLPRPNFAPGNGLPASPLTAVPGTKPTVRSMVDYQGSRVALPSGWIGFSYDDVPFEFTV